MNQRKIDFNVPKFNTFNWLVFIKIKVSNKTNVYIFGKKQNRLWIIFFAFQNYEKNAIYQ